MTVTNTLAFYNKAPITAVKIFIVKAPGVNVLKLYLFIYERSTEIR